MHTVEKYNYLKELSQKLRLRILELTFGVNKSGAHVGGGLSCVEILATLYGSILKFEINNPLDRSRDRFILSKGHAAIALYSVLEQVGFITKEELDQFEVNGSPYYAHASRDLFEGIEFSGGSLSLGLSYAVGVAISCKREELNNHIYVLLGDGECDEGLVWESLMSASHFNLTNLTVIVDCNGLQSDGYTFDIMNHSSLASKFKSFGFNVIDIDGHDLNVLHDALKVKDLTRPNAVIAHTVKGKGVSFMENNKKWHHGSLTLDEYEQAVSEQKY